MLLYDYEEKGKLINKVRFVLHSRTYRYLGKVPRYVRYIPICFNVGILGIIPI